jgi:molybdopterin molybdotransferase
MSEELPLAGPIFHDPRLRGFRSRTSVEDVVALIDGRTTALDPEDIPLKEAAGRVLAVKVSARLDVPPFDRAAMDGYAVRGEETFGADPYSPAFFRIIGRSRPGRRFGGQVHCGEAVEIATGAPIPGGADTVVPVENTTVEGEIVRVVEATPPGRHVGRRGEDLQAGDDVLTAGRTLRPQDLGLLSALGISVVPRDDLDHWR